jgi:hypothetical protein
MLRRHTWAHRLEELLEHVGLTPADELLAERNRWERAADHPWRPVALGAR